MDPFIGEILMFAGTFAPRGYHLCDGSLLPISQYDALYSLLGTMYGGDGQNTFGLPDLRGRVPVHAGTGFIQGQIAGTESVTLSSAQIPAHSHTMLASNDIPTLTSPAGNVTGQAASKIYRNGTPSVSLIGSSTTSVAGGSGQPHENLQPYLCVNFIIALEGIYPSRN